MREPTPELVARRRKLVEETMARVRTIEQDHGQTRQALEAIKNELLSLARHSDVFVTTEFKPAVRGTFKDFVAYRLNDDDGTGRALYLSLALPGKSSPPHNHKNWAVLVGMVGAEENRLYEVDSSGEFRQRETVMVGPGVGVALLGEDIHSIHVQGVGDEPVWQLRFYERALEAQVDREQFDPSGKRQTFPPNPNVKPT
ncbi:hypothetical protein QEP16_12770 [Achromobacter insolitus]|uniref:3-mercaptopropionate dioxygenase n=1 Tax=Achromobacter insolitus TaxID=217204 RepID=A0A6S7F438_9BURK|nr:hypothetical protein [Achromobacter insolitus]GLK94956.1 hypothetical protein GCM10008164_26950 [Achromobacter xylosoxidans]AVG39788.1 hypothetical protein MC81_10545 [Achromobacter insolitus]MCP1402858.1 putative metal-dependent enzyme (double-stranded beta helix superfamily) [Achromobacter insolitus]MDH3064187.1 hypothetical protein [Achromobacter insolitus]MDQ6212282.1 hypothetical protein [Achromobacter insolitus]